MKMVPFWQDTAPVFTGAPATSLPANADVVVIGGGFNGMSAAYNLAKQGLSVVLLEKDDIMMGASTRNGGHCNTGVAHNFSVLADKIGIAKASEAYRAFDNAVKYVDELVREEQLDCDFRFCGKLKLASKASHMAGLRRAYDLIRTSVDKDVALLGRDEVRAEIGSDNFHGALLQQRGGQMHMGKFGIGLANAAARHGAKIYAHHAVTGLHRIQGYQHQVVTAQGSIVAEKVLMATGCSNIGPFPWFKRRIVPMGSFVVVTAPLEEQLLRNVLPKDRTYVTSLNLVNYFRSTVDRRLVFGGRAKFAMSNPTNDPASGEILRDGLYKMFPQLRNTPIDYCWGGMLDMTADRLPRSGEHEGVFYSVGHNGHGTQMSTWMGKIMADYLAEKLSKSPWDRGNWPALAAYSGKPWFLPLAGLYYKAKDRIS